MIWQICNRLFYPPHIIQSPVRAHASTRASGNGCHLSIAGTRRTNTRKAKANENEETKYLDQTEMVRQPGKRPREDDQSNLD